MHSEQRNFLLGTPSPRVELSLPRPDGTPWSLTVSTGMERFIGYYPRLAGFACTGPLLVYRGPALPG